MRRAVVGCLAVWVTACSAVVSSPRVLDVVEFPDFAPDSMPRRFELASGRDLVPVFGYVLAAKEHDPRVSAMITVVGLGGGALSEPDGRYALWVPPGTHILRAEQLGFLADSVQVEVGATPVRSDFLLIELSAEWPCGPPERICVDTLKQ